MLALLKHQGKTTRGGCRSEEHARKISEALMGRTLSEDTKRKVSEFQRSRVRCPMSEETKKNISRALMDRPMSEETKQKLSKALLGRTNGAHSAETREKIGASNRKYWEDYSEEQKKEHLLKCIQGKGAEEARKIAFSSEVYKERKRIAGIRAWSEASEEERHRRLSGIHNEEARVKARPGISMGQKRYWSSLTKEEVAEKVKNSFLSDESILKSRESNNQKPTVPESMMDSYLQKNYPGRWIYNGDNSQRTRVGLRIPDFIRLDGTKEAISVMGGIGIWHFWDDEEVEVEYYKEHGWKCTVIWEWDIPGDLDKFLT